MSPLMLVSHVGRAKHMITLHTKALLQYRMTILSMLKHISCYVARHPCNANIRGYVLFCTDVTMLFPLPAFFIAVSFCSLHV